MNHFYSSNHLALKRFILLLFATLACNLSQPTPTATPVAQVTGLPPTATFEPTPTPLPLPTATPLPVPTHTPTAEPPQALEEQLPNLLAPAGQFASGLTYDIAFSPDGRALLTGGEQGVQLWDISTGKEIRTFNGLTKAVQVAYSPAGQLLAAADDQFTIFIWQASDGSLVNTLHPQPSNDSDHSLVDLAFSPDGSLLVASSVNWEAGNVYVWDAASGRELWAAPGAIDPFPSDLAFHPHQNWLVVRHEGGIVFFDLSNGQVVANWSGPTWFGFALSPDGQLAVSGSEQVNIWSLAWAESGTDPAGESPLFSTTADEIEGLIDDVAIHPTLPLVAFTSLDTVLRLWHYPTNTLAQFPFDPAGAYFDLRQTQLLFDPAGNYLAMTNPLQSNTILWQLR